MAQHGDTVAGKKIEVIIKDDAAVPDNTKRIAQELIVNDKVAFLAGFGVTPAALSVAPLGGGIEDAGNRHRGRHVDHHREVALDRAHQLYAGAIDRADGRLGGRNGIKKVVTMISDYAPGVDAEKSFIANSRRKAERFWN